MNKKQLQMGTCLGRSKKSPALDGWRLARRLALLGMPIALVSSMTAQAGAHLTPDAYLKASNTGVGDGFGYSVATSGDTVVVGAWMEDSNAVGIDGNQTNDLRSNSGAAYVFVRAGTSWMQQAYLKASNPGNGDQFGFAVAISGDTIVVGARLEDSAATGVNGDGNNDDAFGSGAAYVYVRSGGSWVQQAYLKASNTGSNDEFGGNIAIHGDTIVIGARLEDSATTSINGDQANDDALAAGAAYVFHRSGSAWSQQAYLKASNAGLGDQFGSGVSISGDTILIGAAREDSGATGVDGNSSDNGTNDAGAAYVFVRSGMSWTQQAYLKASNTDSFQGFGDQFGEAVAIAGDTAVIGALGEDSNTTGVNGNQADNSASLSGAVYVFVRSGSVWAQQAYLKASNSQLGDSFGEAVAIVGNRIVVGASGEDGGSTGVGGNGADNSQGDSGAVYTFVRVGTSWSQEAYVKASNTGSTDDFGKTLAAGTCIVVGAPFEDSPATGVDGDGSSNLGGSSGAAYVFQLPGPDRSGPSVPLVLLPFPFVVLVP